MGGERGQMMAIALRGGDPVHLSILYCLLPGGSQRRGMGQRGLELIIGAKNDPQWGPVILVGLGGVTAEVMQDVRLLDADLSQAEIVAELNRLKSAALFHGFRGAPALDVAAVAVLIERLGQVLRGTPAIREIDLNPVIVYPQGQGVLALDALMLLDSAAL